MGGLALICFARASYAELDPGTTQSAHEPEKWFIPLRPISMRDLSVALSDGSYYCHLIWAILTSYKQRKASRLAPIVAVCYTCCVGDIGE